MWTGTPGSHASAASDASNWLTMSFRVVQKRKHILFPSHETVSLIKHNASNAIVSRHVSCITLINTRYCPHSKDQGRAMQGQRQFISIPQHTSAASSLSTTACESLVDSVLAFQCQSALPSLNIQETSLSAAESAVQGFGWGMAQCAPGSYLHCILVSGRDRAAPTLTFRTRCAAPL